MRLDMITYMIRRKTDGMYIGSSGQNIGWRKTPKLYGEEQLSYAIRAYNRHGVDEVRYEELKTHYESNYQTQLNRASNLPQEQQQRQKDYYTKYHIKTIANLLQYKDIELIRDVNGVRDVIWTDTKCGVKAKDLFVKSNVKGNTKAPAIPIQIAEAGIETEIGLMLGEIEYAEKMLKTGKLWNVAELEAKVELKTIKLEAVSKQLITRYEELKTEMRRKLDA